MFGEKGFVVPPLLIVLAVLVVAGGTYLLMQQNASSQTPQNSSTQNVTNISQPSANNNSTINPAPTSVAAKSATTVPTQTSVSVQTVRDNNQHIEIQIPTSWSLYSGGEEFIYANGSVVQGKPEPPIIAFQETTIPSGMNCETIVQNTAANDSKKLANFQQKLVTVMGAQSATQYSGIDPNSGYLIRLYACTSQRFYLIQGNFLGSAQSLNTAAINAVNISLATFKVIAP
jgi:hypothetical protein